MPIQFALLWSSQSALSFLNLWVKSFYEFWKFLTIFYSNMCFWLTVFSLSGILTIHIIYTFWLFSIWFFFFPPCFLFMFQSGYHPLTVFEFTNYIFCCVQTPALIIVFCSSRMSIWFFLHTVILCWNSKIFHLFIYLVNLPQHINHSHFKLLYLQIHIPYLQVCFY